MMRRSVFLTVLVTSASAFVTPSYLTQRYTALSATRRAFLLSTAALSFLKPTLPAAADDAVDPFVKVRFELSDPKGGVAYLQECINKEDYESILEFTKTYDQVLRKGGMGKAKKLIEDKEVKAQATSLANAVTFDLIGMNRSSRKGQESQVDAQKYLDELKQDVTDFLELRGK